jgi:lipoate-protein ligase B
MPAVRDWGHRAYVPALEEMRTLVAERRAGRIADTLLLVEHPPVVTVGVQGDDGGADRTGIPVVHVERGGHATYHGPGQLVGYPIVDLDARGRDVRRFVRNLEGLVTDALASVGVGAARLAGQPGVWIDGRRKIASIGIAVDHWISFHGFALNVDLDLEPFSRFQPCGLDGNMMTSLAKELGRPVSVDSMKEPLASAWNRRFAETATSSAGAKTIPVPAPAA